MRNLKKVLALAVASVMLLGMMVVGTSATYSDVATTDNVEAIEVLKALEVMTGDDQGNFNPDQKVTREQMAVVMVNLLGLDTDNYKGAHPFTDVPAWADGFVGAAYTNGIVSGISATEFGTGSYIKAVDAGLMMMKALGYFQYGSDFGSDYQVATIKAADKIDLYDGIDCGAQAHLTRNEVAQLALNALEATCVQVKTAGTESTVIKTGDVDITIPGTAAEYEDVTDDDTFSYDETDATEEGTLQLIEKLYEDKFTKKAGATDLYGRAGYDWQNDDGDTIVLVGEEADYVLVAAEDTTLAKLLEAAKLDKKVLEDGEEDFTAVTVDAGEIVELWVDDDKHIEDSLVYCYVALEIDEIEELDEDLDADEIEAGAAVLITFADGSELLDIQLANYDAKTYVEGAYVLFPYSDDTSDYIYDEVEFIEDEFSADVYYDTTIAATFTGKVQGNGADYVKVDGKKYNNDIIGALTVGTEYTFVKDVNGVILGAVEVEDEDETFAIDDVVFVYDEFTSAPVSDKFGNTVTTTYAQLIDTKGVVSEVVIKVVKDYAELGKADDVFGVEGYDRDTVYTTKAYTTNKWFVGDEAASEGDLGAVNYKGTTKLTAWDYDTTKIAVLDGEGADFATDASKTTGGIRYNDKVQFIVVEGTEDEVEVEVKTGKVNATLADGAIIIADKVNGNNVAALVYAPLTVVSGSISYDEVIYIDTLTADDIYLTEVEVDDDVVEVAIFEAYNAKGEKVEITVRADAVVYAGFHTYSIEDGIYTLEYLGNDAEEQYDGENGAIYGEFFASYYGTLLTTYNGIEDLETEGAVWIDLHETDEDEGAVWTKSIKNLAALKKAATEAGAVLNIAVYAEDEAAKIIVITDGAVTGELAANYAVVVNGTKKGITVEVTDIAVGDALKLELYAGDKKLQTATMTAFGTAHSCCFYIAPYTSSNWTQTVWNADVDEVPTSAKLYVNGCFADELDLTEWIDGSINSWADLFA